MTLHIDAIIRDSDRHLIIPSNVAPIAENAWDFYDAEDYTRNELRIIAHKVVELKTYKPDDQQEIYVEAYTQGMEETTDVHDGALSEGVAEF